MPEIIRDLAERPLCPNGFIQPVHPAHRVRTQVLDAFYHASDKDAEGEMSEPLERAYRAAANGEGLSDERMWLYRESVSFARGREYVTVESWWFRCLICGLILPASRVRS